MERPYAVLQNKLDELESILNEIFFHAANKEDKSEFYDEIVARIGFLKTLHAAEMESNAQGTPQHLPHIARRLAALEDAFHSWLDSGMPPEDHVDDPSVCSCTHSCFNDVVEDDDRVPEPEYFVPMPNKMQVMSSARSEEDIGEQRKRRRLGSLPCGLMSRAVVAVAAMSAAAAVAAMVIGSATNFSRVEERVFLVPT
ncbi:hypothetical protein COCNU_07G005850 [Cocos nucifera]|uniref:DUF7610 domain-containing protein n=1 Tax=Cocos nucifera TaxID=13894 RepID=A0A8K0IER5_COCNU|nr:hypothetical protein COCNU_07G005850 [Cocos nucifera]